MGGCGGGNAACISSKPASLLRLLVLPLLLPLLLPLPLPLPQLEGTVVGDDVFDRSSLTMLPLLLLLLQVLLPLLLLLLSNGSINSFRTKNGSICGGNANG